MLIYVTKYISRKVRKYGDSWEKCGVCVTFTGVCVLTQVVALSAVTLVRAVDVHTLVTTRTAQTLIHICIMTHTRSGSVNRIPGCRINSVHHPCSYITYYSKNSITVPPMLIPCDANLSELSALCVFLHYFISFTAI